MVALGRSLGLAIVDVVKADRQVIPTLEATQGQMDGFFCQLLYKCHFEEVVSVRD